MKVWYPIRSPGQGGANEVFVNSIFGQEANPYLYEWDSLDLSGSSLPVMMPYNRIIYFINQLISPQLPVHIVDKIESIKSH